MWGLIANALTRLATSHVNYWFGFMVDAAVAVSFCVLALRYVHGTWATWTSVVLAGLSLYGLMEYLFHRWIYHGGRSPAATGHLMHHEDPQALIGLPFFFPATVAFALWFLFRRMLGEGEASLMMAAVVTNLLYYGLLHHSQHHGRLKAGYFQRMRSYHLIHHHFPDRNFGLTMTLWDAPLAKWEILGSFDGADKCGVSRDVFRERLRSEAQDLFGELDAKIPAGKFHSAQKTRRKKPAARLRQDRPFTSPFSAGRLRLDG